jgi:hypothetical protein
MTLRVRLASLVLILSSSSSSLATAGVHVACRAEGALFPSNRFTVLDFTQNTGRRLNLPRPSCAARPSDCADVDVINTLDGFNVQPRLSIAFDGPIDVSTVNSRTVFLVHLGSTQPGGGRVGHVVGVNQIVWDPIGLTLHAEADETLEPHTRYLLVVTNGVRDTTGAPVSACSRRGAADAIEGVEGSNDGALSARALLAALPRVIAASLFTTQSTTSTLEKIRAQIKASRPTAADFVLGDGGRRTVFPAATVSGIVFQREVAVGTFVPAPVPVSALAVVPGAVGTIAFGRYSSPDYETAGGFIPATPTRTGLPAVQRHNDVFFTLFLPAGARPATGWPVALFGHGLGDNKNSSPFAVASVLAASGIATIGINVVGHGGGPASALVVGRADGTSVTLSAGGRSIDQNGDGRFDPTEGVFALPPQTIVSNRDGLQQTVVDLLQLVREIEIGVDVDGDGQADLDRTRISYFGQSFGGIYGTLFLAVEPNIHSGVVNVGGGSIVDVSRLGGFRPLLTQELARRLPPLLNQLGGFDENLPLRNRPPVVNAVPGALEIQQFFDRMEWVSQPANPVAYARHLRTAPLRGVAAKSVLLQFAKGDQTVPNPTNTAIIRAGNLADRTTYLRNDLAFAADPTIPKNPHSFLTRLTVPSAAPLAIGAQGQIATFLASNGTVIVDPDGAGPLFEVPIVPPLPEDLSFIP